MDAIKFHQPNSRDSFFASFVPGIIVTRNHVLSICESEASIVATASLRFSSWARYFFEFIARSAGSNSKNKIPRQSHETESETLRGCGPGLTHR